MKVLNLLIILLVIAGIYSCNDEDKIVAELGGPDRDYDVNSTDPVKKIVSEYYFAYEKEFIVDPDSSDYLFNFVSKNGVIMYPVNPEANYLLSTVKLFKAAFLDGYSDDFKKKYFPYSIIIADTIYDTGTYLTPKKVDYFFRMNYYAVNMSDKVKLDLDAQKAYFAAIHIQFLTEYCATYKDIKIDNTFATVYESKSRLNGKQLSVEEGYAEGFVKVSVGHSFFGGDYTDFPSLEYDLPNTFTFLLTTPASEYARVTSTYAKIKEKCDAIIKDLDVLGINYKKMIFNGINN